MFHCDFFFLIFGFTQPSDLHSMGESAISWYFSELLKESLHSRDQQCACWLLCASIYMSSYRTPQHPFSVFNYIPWTHFMNKSSLVGAPSQTRFIQSAVGLYPENEVCKENLGSEIPLLYQILTSRPTLVQFVASLKSSFPLVWKGTVGGGRRRHFSYSPLQRGQQPDISYNRPLCPPLPLTPPTRFSWKFSVQCTRAGHTHLCQPCFCS